jgi:hypothetical protein
VNPWKQLLEVQALDTTLDQLAHRAANLPDRARLAEVEDRLGALRRDVAVVESERHGLVKEQTRLEDEIASVEDKIASVDRQLYSGGSDVKQLQALQGELGSLKRRVSSLEDEELELLERLEPLDARLAELAASRADLDAEAIDATRSLAEGEAEIDRERAVVLARRAELVIDVDPGALAEYEQVRGRLGGVAVARLEHGSCGACHMKLSAVEHDRILHLPADEPVRCDDCGRFLVRD